MPVQILALLTLIAIIVVVLAFDWVSADVVGLGAMLTLILTGLLPSAQAFAGLGSDTVLLLLSLLILTAALIRTGVVDAIARAVRGAAG